MSNSLEIQLKAVKTVKNEKEWKVPSEYNNKNVLLHASFIYTKTSEKNEL